MRQTLLDTSFILTCIKNKIDFFEQFYFEGIKILIPEQVIKELDGLAKRNMNAKLALQIIRKNKSRLVIIQISGKNTDNSIINYARKNPDIIIATLDKEIKLKIKNPKLVIRNKKKLEIV